MRVKCVGEERFGTIAWNAVIEFDPATETKKVSKMCDLMFHDLGWVILGDAYQKQTLLRDVSEYETFLEAWEECLAKVEKEAACNV